jgi:uncharacterized protein
MSANRSEGARIINVRTIDFQSRGIVCERNLCLPDGFDVSMNHPALVIGHGFATVRSNLAEEGRLFAEAGFVALAIDYRHFGGSGGEPRGRVWPIQEAEDFRSAIDWLEVQPGVDANRIDIWGTSFAGGVVTRVAAHDQRVRACVAQAPILDGDAWLRSVNREHEYLAIREHLLDERRKRATGKPDAVHPTRVAPPRRLRTDAGRSGDERGHGALERTDRHHADDRRARSDARRL